MSNVVRNNSLSKSFQSLFLLIEVEVGFDDSPIIKVLSMGKWSEPCSRSSRICGVPTMVFKVENSRSIVVFSW